MSDRRPLGALALAFAACATTPAAPPALRWEADLEAYRAHRARLAADVLISGDQVLPKITTNVSVWPEQPHANPLRLYLDSLDRFEPLPATTLVLPSHGLPFRGLRARLAELRDHHAARLGEAVDALVEPRSAAELVPVLFRRELDPHQLAFALGEALAHLRFLEEDGRVVRQVGADGVHRFLKA